MAFFFSYYIFSFSMDFLMEGEEEGPKKKKRWTLNILAERLYYDHTRLWTVALVRKFVHL